MKGTERPCAEASSSIAVSDARFAAVRSIGDHVLGRRQLNFVPVDLDDDHAITIRAAVEKLAADDLDTNQHYRVIKAA